MRRSRRLLATLVVLLLALSCLMAGASTWAWVQSNPSSETLVELPETSAEEPEKSMKVSKVSEATSKVKSEKHPEYVTIPYEDFVRYTGMIEEGNALNKKGGETVSNGAQGLKDAAKPERMVKPFATIDGAFAPENAFELGVGAGIIFKDALVLKVGVAKKNILEMEDWLQWKDAYKATASVGLIF